MQHSFVHSSASQPGLGTIGHIRGWARWESHKAALGVRAVPGTPTVRGLLVVLVWWPARMDRWGSKREVLEVQHLWA